MNKYKMLLISTLSNLHAGSGETHFSIVDNAIQKDPVTKVPVIHASGIKGALKEYFKTVPGYSAEDINLLFGKESGDSGIEGPGRLIFFEASMITLPLRSFHKVYYHTSSPHTITEYLIKLKLFVNNSAPVENLISWLKRIPFDDNKIFCTFSAGTNEIEVEDFASAFRYTADEGIKEDIKKYLGVEIGDLAIFNDAAFSAICDDYLPVVARNHLDNGKSINLFYEEYLPRNTQLYFILGEENNILKEKFNGFVDILTAANRIVQFGGNHSVGYGFSSVRQWIAGS